MIYPGIISQACKTDLRILDNKISGHGENVGLRLYPKHIRSQYSYEAKVKAKSHGSQITISTKRSTLAVKKNHIRVESIFLHTVTRFLVKMFFIRDNCQYEL